ncbi:MAG: Veg family protein [Clostridia bacterium]|nr:Veg family protein [Clostridia bacterium]
MRKSITTLDDIKRAVLSLKGEQVELYINRGRRKVLKFEGTIDNVYTSVFTVKDKIASSLTHTYSYSDILCGEVKITKLAE